MEEGRRAGARGRGYDDEGDNADGRSNDGAIVPSTANAAAAAPPAVILPGLLQVRA